MIDELDRKIIGFLQKDIPVDPAPYLIISKWLGVSEDEVLNRIRRMAEEGIIRRLGATLYHHKAGFRANAMVAWVIPEQKIDEAGNIMARFREVTHCYYRSPQKGWRYNLYTMIHGDTREECFRIAEKMAEKAGETDYSLLFSEKEFKKSSMEYY
ncbi:MAG: Lrp/AsnC family transcriptional regulator [Deltaproteobacteria bacterium]|jgi:DNA-binding Lrp family transcriptional regulator|nr:Lrp/AsnC family transcriptional regulator [Deltaproteobacteria bacterium]